MRLPLADVALAVLGHLGHIGEVLINDEDRPRHGNYLYGAFGRDFVTSDGHRVMVAAITPRQFRGLVAATSTEGELTALEARHGISLQSDGDLFHARADIAAILEPWFAATPLRDVERRFREHRVLWGPYQSMRRLLESDPRASLANPLFAEIDQPGVGPLLTPGTPLDLGAERMPPMPAPRLGQHTEQILGEVLNMTSAEIGKMVAKEVVAVG
jgi:2-methylfumaryl-CoA isomerase